MNIVDIIAIGFGLLIIAVVLWNVRGHGQRGDSSIENPTNMGPDDVEFDCD